MLPPLLLGFSALFFALPTTSTADHHLNATCMAEAFARLEANVDRVFKRGYQTKELMDARIETVDADHNLEIVALWSLPDVDADARLISPRRGKVEDVSGALAVDQVLGLGLSAKLTESADGDAHLTVATGNASTSCSYRLSAHVQHGRVLTRRHHPDLAFFRFSPDGRYLAYTAEERSPRSLRRRRRHWRRRLRFAAPRPVVVLYHVESMTFRRLESVPARYSVGQLHWHPDAETLLGVAWRSGPPALLTYPRGTNRESFLCAMDAADSYFRVLTKPGLHVEAPRVSPDGSTLVYLENCLHSSTFRRFYPGTDEISRRLVRVRWADAEACMRDRKLVDADAKEVVVGNSQMANVSHPEVLPDGTTFYGLYPWRSEAGNGLLLPERVFSEDGGTVYLTVNQLSAATLMAVRLDTRQVTLYPLEGYQLLDVHRDVLLALYSKVNIKPGLRVGRLHDDYFTTTTVSTTTTTETTTSTEAKTTTSEATTTSEITTTTTDSTTEDPCAHLKQDDDNSTSTTDGDASPSSHDPAAPPPSTTTNSSSTNSSTEAPPAPSTLPPSSTAHPHATPLRLASVYFKSLGPPGLGLYREKLLVFDTPHFRESTCPQSFFTATFSYRMGFQPMPLAVVLHRGPHGSAGRAWSRRRNTFLDLGVAVLEVNYRGSRGMGDESLQAIVGNVGEMAVSDVHQAVEFALETEKSLLLPRVALVGDGFGALVAATLAARHPDRYPVLVSEGGLLDPSALRFADQYLHALRGVNYTREWTMDKDMLNYWWDRSALRLLPSVRASTLLVAGEEDLEVPAHAHALPFHRGLLALGVPTRFVGLPGEGAGHAPVRGVAALRTLAQETHRWLHRHWGSYELDCALYEMSTDSSGRPVTTTTEFPESSTTTSARVSGAAAATATKAAAVAAALAAAWMVR